MESITSAGVPLDTTMHLLEQGEKYIPCSRTQDNSSEQGGYSTFASPQAMLLLYQAQFACWRAPPPSP